MAQEARLRERQGAQASEACAPPAMLAPFVRYLEEAGLMELHVRGSGPAREADHAAADNAIRLQALVMLGNRLGLGAPYGRDGYAFGPASLSLAGDAPALERDRARLYDGVPASVPGPFERERFERLVAGKDTDWLVTASTLAQMRAHRDTRGDLIDAVSDGGAPGRRPKHTGKYVSGVLRELEHAGLVTAYV